MNHRTRNPKYTGRVAEATLAELEHLALGGRRAAILRAVQAGLQVTVTTHPAVVHPTVEVALPTTQEAQAPTILEVAAQAATDRQSW